MIDKYLYKGQWLTLKEISAITGLKYSTLYNRYQRGWEMDRINTPSRFSREYKFSLSEPEKEEDAFTRAELWELFVGFHNSVPLREEYRVMADFMGKEIVDPEVREVVKVFRERFFKERGKK